MIIEEDKNEKSLQSSQTDYGQQAIRKLSWTFSSGDSKVINYDILFDVVNSIVKADSVRLVDFLIKCFKETKCTLRKYVYPFSINQETN